MPNLSARNRAVCLRLGFIVGLLALSLILGGQWSATQAAPIVGPDAITNTYFGGNGSEIIRGVAHDPDGNIVVVGSTVMTQTGSLNFSPPSTTNLRVYGPTTTCSVSNSQAGFVAKFDRAGRSLVWFGYFTCGTATPSRVVVDGSGNIYVAGLGYANFSSLSGSPPSGQADPFVLKLSEAGNVVWGSLQPGDESLDDVHIGLVNGSEPVVSGRVGSKIFLAHLNATGTQQLAYTNFSDPANPSAYTYLNGLTTRPTDNRVFAVGYTQVGSNLKVPYLLGLDAGLNLQWRDYATPVAGKTADSVGRAIGLGADGNLVAAFTADGGNTVLAYDPLSPNPNSTIGQLNGAYQSSHGFANGSAPSSFVGRYDPTTGNILDASFFHATLQDGRTNTTRVLGVATDTRNRVYLSGVSAFGLPFTADAFSSTYIGKDSFLVIMNATLSGLDYATYLNYADNRALAVNRGWAVLGGSSKSGLVTRFAIQPQYNPGGDGQLAVFGVPTRLAFATSPQVLTAGQSSGPITIEYQDAATGQPQLAPAPISFSLTSSSQAGRFDLSPAGTFNQISLSLTLPTGQSSLTFYYRDTQIGFPVITASLPADSGFESLSQTHTVVSLNVNPATLQFAARQPASLPPTQTVSISWSGPGNPNWSKTNIIYGSGATGWLNLSKTSGPTSPPDQLGLQPSGLLSPGVYTATVVLSENVYSTTARLSVEYSVITPKIKFISQAQTVSPGQNSGAITIELQEATGNRPVRVDAPLQINLTSIQGSGVFSLTPGGAAITSLTLPANTTRASFYYTAQSDSTLGLSAPGTLSDSQLFTVSQPCPDAASTQVNNSADGLPTDPCQITLREAVERAKTGGQPVTFSSAITTSILTSTLDLPANFPLTGRCTTNQPGIWLDGASSGPGTAGLNLAGGNALNGLAIYGFGGWGVRLSGSASSFKCGMLGTSDGLVPRPNGNGSLQFLVGGKLVVNNSSGGSAGLLVWQKPPDW